MLGQGYHCLCYPDQKMIPGQGLMLNILRDGRWTSWFCCIAVWISSSDLAQHWIRPQRLSDTSVQLSALNCVNADWMIEFCLSVNTIICTHLEFFGTRILVHVFWSEMIPGQGLMLNIQNGWVSKSWFCCIAVWISSSDLAQYWIRP